MNRSDNLHSNDVSISNSNTYERIGALTRELHENLRAFDIDKIVETVKQELPNANDRLRYVAELSKNAADKVLNATDEAIPIQTNLVNQSVKLNNDWYELLNKQSLRSEYNLTANRTLEFLKLTGSETHKTKDLLIKIIMSQDFQDLTGQVIQKIIASLINIETQLLELLVDSNNAQQATTSQNEPELKNSKNSEMLQYKSQKEVDDLLDDLGF